MDSNSSSAAAAAPATGVDPGGGVGQAAVAANPARAVPFPAQGTDAEKAAWRQNNGLAATWLEPQGWRSVSAAQRASYERLASDLERGGVHPSAGKAALTFFSKVKGPVEAQEKKHNYDLSRSGFNPNAPYVVAFANALFETRAAQADVDKLFEVFRTRSARRAAAQYRNTERLDRRDTQRAMNWMRAEFGDETQASLRLLKAYVAGLSPAEREKLESERDENGVAALNSPKRLRALLGLARGGGKTAPQKPPAEERAEIEKVMKEDRGRYFKDERMQARYRDLLRDGATSSGKPEPKDRAGTDAEIAKLEKRMRTDRAAYNSDEVAQARLRKLYTARGGG